MTSRSTRKSFAETRILIVDDNLHVLTSLQLLMQTVGYVSEGCSDPIQAITLIERFGKQYDVILCDIKMPLLSGIELLKIVGSARPELPIVMMSGHATKQEQHEVMRLGAVAFLQKPFFPTDFTTIIEPFLRKPAQSELMKMSC
jgi:DNA-binding NtrC family response regulator